MAASVDMPIQFGCDGGGAVQGIDVFVSKGIAGSAESAGTNSKKACLLADSETNFLVPHASLCPGGTWSEVDSEIDLFGARVQMEHCSRQVFVVSGGSVRRRH